jgi:hypothetical protein
LSTTSGHGTPLICNSTKITTTVVNLVKVSHCELLQMTTRRTDNEVDDVEDTKDTDSLISRSLEIESPKGDTTAQKEPSPAAEEGGSVMTKGIFCFVGLQISYLTWGMMQEVIMTTKFEPTAEVPSGYFPSASFCVLANRVVAILVAYTVCMYKHGTVDCGVPVWHFLPSAISNTMSSWAQYKALNYVSFPLQNLFKSTKVIPVMGMGRLLRGVTYTLTEYTEAIVITCGVVVFSMAKGGHGDTERNMVSRLSACVAIKANLGGGFSLA